MQLSSPWKCARRACPASTTRPERLRVSLATCKAQSFHLYLFFCGFVPFFPLNFDMLVSVFARFDTLEAPRPCLAEPVFASICSKPFVYACGGCSKSWFCASLGSSVFEARRFDQFSKTRVFTGSPPSNVVGGLPQETAGGKPSESKKKRKKSELRAHRLHIGCSLCNGKKKTRPWPSSQAQTAYLPYWESAQFAWPALAPLVEACVERRPHLALGGLDDDTHAVLPDHRNPQAAARRH